MQPRKPQVTNIQYIFIHIIIHKYKILVVSIQATSKEKEKGRINELIDINVGFGFWCDKRARHLPNRTPPVQYQSTSGRVNFIITVNRQK